MTQRIIEEIYKNRMRSEAPAPRGLFPRPFLYLDLSNTHDCLKPTVQRTTMYAFVIFFDDFFILISFPS